MKVGLLTAGLLLTSAIASHAAIVNISPPPPSQPSSKSQAPLPPLPPVPLPPSDSVITPAPTSAPVATKASAPAIAKAPAPAKASAPVAASAPTPRPATAESPVLAKAQAKVRCPCDCPKDHAVSQSAQARAVPHRARYADSGYYSYGAAAPVIRREWHGQWRVAPNDAAIPGSVSPHGYYQEGVPVDDRGWTGGVGAAPDGGGGGGFIDGYGQAHFANGGSVENGPSYNSYGQSFQYNPSQAGPFQPRSMGGFAPPSR
jgi:hypothetical protein